MITLNPRKETIEFSIVNYEGKLEVVAFKHPQVRTTGRRDRFLRLTPALLPGVRQELAQDPLRRPPTADHALRRLRRTRLRTARAARLYRPQRGSDRREGRQQSADVPRKCPRRSPRTEIRQCQTGNFSLQIDLQWMVINCDPTRPERETCDELPVSAGHRTDDPRRLPDS